MPRDRHADFRPEDLADRIDAAAAGIALLPAGATQRIAVYLAELVRWNRAFNLTSVTEPGEMIQRHVLDSLSIRPHLHSRRIVDAGTGAGLPGVILAIAEPERRFVLVDAGGKKVRFLRHLARLLPLNNVEPVQARLESLQHNPPPDEVVARALAPLPTLVEWTQPWLARGARLLAMKGQLADAERSAVPDAYNVAVEPLDWPGRHGARCLVIVSSGGAD